MRSNISFVISLSTDLIKTKFMAQYKISKKEDSQSILWLIKIFWKNKTENKNIQTQLSPGRGLYVLSVSNNTSQHWESRSRFEHTPAENFSRAAGAMKHLCLYTLNSCGRVSLTSPDSSHWSIKTCLACFSTILKQKHKIQMAAKPLVKQRSTEPWWRSSSDDP